MRPARPRRRLVSNFKTSSSIRLGELGRLQPLTEQGEFQHVGRAEEAEELKIGTYGAALHISRKLLIDDDLSLLADTSQAFGVAAAQTEADLLVALFSDNPMMKDGTTVFHASRGNLMAGGGAGTGLGDTGAASFLAQARSALRAVKGVDGKTIVGAAPKYLLVGPDSEDAALRLLTETTPARASDVNTLAGVAELIVDPRIPGEDWYLLADPARMPGIVIAYLASAPGVQVQRAEAWDTLGLKFRAWIDMGCGWTDWRGAYKGA